MPLLDVDLGRGLDPVVDEMHDPLNPLDRHAYKPHALGALAWKSKKPKGVMVGLPGFAKGSLAAAAIRRADVERKPSQAY